MVDADPWAIGTPITETHPLHAMIMAWASIEKTLEEWNIPQAEPRAKAIMARLASLDPPVLPVHPHEMRDENENEDEQVGWYTLGGGFMPLYDRDGKPITTPEGWKPYRPMYVRKTEA